MPSTTPHRRSNAAARTRFAATLAAFAIGAAMLAGLGACRQEQTSALPAGVAAIAETSVSGISSGAYMAGQFQLAHADVVVGAGIIAGGPYGCAESIFADVMPGPASAFLNATKAINGCMLNAMQIWGVPNPPMLADKARRLASEVLIAPLTAIQHDRVYLFTGRSDRTVVPAIVEAAASFYKLLGLPPEQIKFVADMDAGHAFVTETEGLACDETSKPYIVDCDYDQAGDLLSFIYGRLEPRNNAPSGRFILYDQRPYTRDLVNHGMADSGVAYVPRACADSATSAAQRCRVHIAFHGCGQNRQLVGEAFIQSTGFDRWADSNRMIVLFPQTETSPFNPQACWDWWGYTGRDYLTRRAPQIVAVHRMLLQLAHGDRQS